jgi:hypothetical protein
MHDSVDHRAAAGLTGCVAAEHPELGRDRGEAFGPERRAYPKVARRTVADPTQFVDEGHVRKVHTPAMELRGQRSLVGIRGHVAGADRPPEHAGSPGLAHHQRRDELVAPRHDEVGAPREDSPFASRRDDDVLVPAGDHREAVP